MHNTENNRVAKKSTNSTSLAGEFAVLSQLALRGFDANMTLGYTKHVDILVSNPQTGKMYKLEVKTKDLNKSKNNGSTELFGRYLCSWVMSEKHEKISDPNLFYCFVAIKDYRTFIFYIVPSRVVAAYVKKEHEVWMKVDKKHKESGMRTFRIGMKTEKYSLDTPFSEQYENNWNFQD